MNNGVLCFANNNSKVNYIPQAQELASGTEAFKLVQDSNSNPTSMK